MQNENPPRFKRGKSPEQSKQPIESPFKDRNSLTDFFVSLSSKEENVYYKTLCDNTLERVLKDLDNGEIGDPTTLYSLTKKAYRGIPDDLYEGLNLYREALSKIILRTQPRFFSWIRESVRIMGNLTKLRNRGLLPIIKDLTNRIIPFSKSKVWAEIKIKGKKRWPALVLPDVSGIAWRTGISKSQVWKYIEEGVRLGFWKWFESPGHSKHGGAYLIMGYWNFYKGKKGWEANVIYLIDRTKENKLRNFWRPD